MAVKPKSYGEVLAGQRQALADARLNDPGEHFPYKIDDAIAASRSSAMGPQGPDDDSVMGEDFLTEELARLTEAYVIAQGKYLASLTDDDLRSAYQAAAAALAAGRRAHRINRQGMTMTGVPTRARRAGE